MTQAEFNKLNKGSIVCFSLCAWFQGVVVTKLFFDRDGKGERNCVYVDFPPNTSTGGFDPAPAWYDAMSLNVVSYASGGNPEPHNIDTVLIKNTIKNVIGQLDAVNKLIP